MTKDEILEEFRALLAQTADPEGYFTADELCGTMGLGKVSVQRRLKLAQQAGRLSVVRVKRPAIDGRLMHIPAYRIEPSRD
jgi:response regulator of citrate/malate metabolism